MQRELIQDGSEREREVREYAQRRGYSERKMRALLVKRQRNATAFVKKQRALLKRIEKGDADAIEEARRLIRAMEAMEAAITESYRRERRDFDVLLGNFDEASSGLLRDIVSYLRDYLLDRYCDEEARHLLAVFEPRKGHQNMPVVDADVELALTLLNMIGSASRCKGVRFANLILGKAGARDQKRQAGTRKPKRPWINEWIEKKLQGDPYAKSPDLWNAAPQEVTDTISIDAFRKRVTAVRKLRCK